MGFLLSYSFLVALAAFLLGLLLGWIIWGRLTAEVEGLRADRARIKDERDACVRTRGELEQRLRDAGAKTVKASPSQAAEPVAIAAAPAALIAAPMKKAAAKPAKRTTEVKANPVATMSKARPAPASKANPARNVPAVVKPKAKSPAKPKAASAAKPAKALPDDLRLILGVGKTNEKKLHEAGVTTFAQIAGWKEADVKRVGALINFGERIVKERWIEQARLLAKGDMDAFYKAFPAAKGEGNT